jgi:putative addiction module killer protein
MSFINDIVMPSVCTTEIFDEWLDGLRDRRAQAVIARRILRIEGGLLGDIKSVGGNVSEIRIDFGPGYRLYFTYRGQEVIILLCGSDKSDQRRAIAQAQAMVGEV